MKEDNKLNESFFGDWIARQKVKEFFGYGQTKMSEFSKTYSIRVAKVGNKIFYSISDIKKLLDESSNKPVQP